MFRFRIGSRRLFSCGMTDETELARRFEGFARLGLESLLEDKIVVRIYRQAIQAETHPVACLWNFTLVGSILPLDSSDGKGLPWACPETKRIVFRLEDCGRRGNPSASTVGRSILGTAERCGCSRAAGEQLGEPKLDVEELLRGRSDG